MQCKVGSLASVEGRVGRSAGIDGEDFRVQVQQLHGLHPELPAGHLTPTPVQNFTPAACRSTPTGMRRGGRFHQVMATTTVYPTPRLRPTRHQLPHGTSVWQQCAPWR